MADNRNVIDEFINALQLCLNIEISDIHSRDDDIVVRLSGGQTQDSRLDDLKKLFPHTKDAYGILSFLIPIHEAVDRNLIQFLQLTRLDRENIQKIIEIDSRYEGFANKLGLFRRLSNLETLHDASRAIFRQVEKKSMTIRQIADSTGLTQVAISNFKSGKDVKLSNFLKITRAVGLKAKLE